MLNLTLYFSLSHPGFLGKKSMGNAELDLETDSHQFQDFSGSIFTFFLHFVSLILY